MISTSELSELVATLYAAPLQPEKWQAFFDGLCALTNVASGFMVSVGPEEGNQILAGGGINFDPAVFRLYNEYYGANDPYAEPAIKLHGVGLIQGDELVSRTDLLKSELYNDLLAPYDLAHMTLISCRGSMPAGQVFPLWRSPKHGPMDAASIHLLQMLVPHMQTALLLRAKVAASHAPKLFSETALDAMGIAAILVNWTGGIRHMNQLAAAHLKRANGLTVHNGRLKAMDPQEDAQLQFLIVAASGEKHASASLPGGAMKILLPRERTSLQVSVVPAPEQFHQIGGPYALVFIGDPSSPPKSRAALMRQLYRLTPVEARLSDLLLQGLEVRDAAEQLGTTLETARFHLKRVLAKTDTRRQTELMRLMLSLPGMPDPPSDPKAH
jgi:DNA-binding CsgD family transcriptional regulator